ncbi:uncharacterized protein LOC125178480 [Hyalella azteca]|uniref:Uncharacterized protein LOC125178480 n=1 Tax=Hyalella azteca TaxID=294128 RepID=A0A979FMF3_HYAAZ|nr:uncharacterized protein LOC125178480 [Hyalella azteca]
MGAAGTTIRDVVITKANTSDGSLANQRRLCRAEGSEPLVIKTKQVRDKAVQLVKEYAVKVYPSLDKVAWLSATGDETNLSLPFTWPDGSDISNCASNTNDTKTPFLTDGPATRLSEKNVILRAIMESSYGFKVLCST